MKKRYLLSGGCDYTLEFHPSLETTYGFENLRYFFDDRWVGGHAPFMAVLEKPEKYLSDVNFWLISLNYSDRDVADKFRAASRYARSRGCLIGGEPNGGYHANLFQVAPFVRDLWTECCDFLTNPTINDDMIAAFEKVYGAPFFGCPAPVCMDMHRREIANMESRSHKFTLPEDIDQYFMFGTLAKGGNDWTIQAAELMGIPLIVHGDLTLIQPWVDRFRRDQGEFRNVRFLPHVPTQYEWMWQVKHSRGIFHSNVHPSTGRYTLYAALLGKPSISNHSAFQEILYPDAVMPTDATAFINWRDWERRAQAELAYLPARLAELSPAEGQNKLHDFISQTLPNWINTRRAA